MAGIEKMQQQLRETREQFQADIDASVIRLDPPITDEYGNHWGWDVTMPREEYHSRQQHIEDLRNQIKQAQQDEQMGLACDHFLYSE